jgi:hypothetical protein
MLPYDAVIQIPSDISPIFYLRYVHSGVTSPNASRCYQPPPRDSLDEFLGGAQTRIVHCRLWSVDSMGDDCINHQPLRPARFRCGGPGSISHLLILKELMNRLEYERDVEENTLYPADHFDLFGAVSYGA